MSRLIVGQSTWNDLRDHLFSDGFEHLAFILAESVNTKKAFCLLARELVLVPDEDLDGEKPRDGLSLKLEALLKVMNRANQLKCTIIEAHSHPFSDDYVEFSYVDLHGQKEIVAYLNEVFPERPYAALVLGKNSVRGLHWFPDKTKPVDLEEVRVVGGTMNRLCAQGGSLCEKTGQNQGKEVEGTHHRQVLALGNEGQIKMQQTRVGIVGLGGVGSIVAQQLAYLGVAEFVLVDDDSVDPTNHHRLVTASKRDIGTPKAEVAKNYLKHINPFSLIESLCLNTRSSKAMAALQGCDIIFGCVDTDAGRLILNELSNAYIIPYIDCGVGINLHESKMAEAGGRVIVWAPGRPCLLCCNEINTRIAAEELESFQELEFRKQYGYVVGANLPEPAVISLNGVIASVAVTEFLAFVAGFRDSYHYTYYDMLEQKLGRRSVSKDDRCTVCAIQGLGDRANVSRYDRVGLPADLPKI